MWKFRYSVGGPLVWNSLPAAVREADSLHSSRRKLKTHQFTFCFIDYLFLQTPLTYLLSYFHVSCENTTRAKRTFLPFDILPPSECFGSDETLHSTPKLRGLFRLWLAQVPSPWRVWTHNSALTPRSLYRAMNEKTPFTLPHRTPNPSKWAHWTPR